MALTCPEAVAAAQAVRKIAVGQELHMLLAVMQLAEAEIQQAVDRRVQLALVHSQLVGHSLEDIDQESLQEDHSLHDHNIMSSNNSRIQTCVKS